jgi:L-ribulose-5-phosphate 3-epimerase
MKLAVVTDELSQDFAHACQIASREFGMGFVELRSLWNKNVVNLDAKEIAEVHRILQGNNLRVIAITGPLFKVDWPNAPKSKFSVERDQFGADFTFDQQDEVLQRSLALAKEFNTDRVRCFDFWRLDDPAPYHAAMYQKLLDAATTAGKKGVTLILENEHACNTATAAESAETLKAVPSPYFMLNWDPGNAAMRGETPYPGGYNLLPKDRIGHCHCKDVTKAANGEYKWECIGRGAIDWVGQIRALKNDGYRDAISLETHWRGAGTPEESTRMSWAGMKEKLQKAGALDS